MQRIHAPLIFVNCTRCCSPSLYLVVVGRLNPEYFLVFDCFYSFFARLISEDCSANKHRLKSLCHCSNRKPVHLYIKARSRIVLRPLFCLEQSQTSLLCSMCLPFGKKADVEAGLITVRRRYSPRKEECVLEIVKRRPAIKEVTFWVCACGIRLHTDIVICTECGRHRHHHRGLPVEPRPEEDKCSKALEELKKELDGLCKDFKEIKGTKEKKPEPTQPPPPPPKPTPVLPQMQFIPLIPAPYLAEPPKPADEPKPSPKHSPKPRSEPEMPPPQPPPPLIVNNYIPTCPEREIEGPRRRRRDPSPVSSCSEVSVGSFQRVRRHVNVLGRRLWHLEDREALREDAERQELRDELQYRRQMDGRRRIIDVEDRARQRAIEHERDELAARERREREREREVDWDLDRERRELERREHRERARERSFWRRREWDLPLHYHSPESRLGWIGRGFGPYVERWEAERTLLD